MSINYLSSSLFFSLSANRWGMLQISMRLNEERELQQSLVKTSFSPSLIRGAWSFSLSNRLKGCLDPFSHLTRV
jgi:hypothetical protein